MKAAGPPPAMKAAAAMKAAGGGPPPPMKTAGVAPPGQLPGAIVAGGGGLLPGGAQMGPPALPVGPQYRGYTLALGVLQAKYGTERLLWFFSGMCAATWLFAKKYVPETKGKSLEEIGGGG